MSNNNNKKATAEAPAARKGATEAMDDSLFTFDYDEQMKVREGRPWKKVGASLFAFEKEERFVLFFAAFCVLQL
jgi:hypothetical protein